MDRDDRSDGGRTGASDGVPIVWPKTAAGVEVMGAYDDIDGAPVFVIAALDCDDAWIAVSDGDELEVGDWA